MFGKNAPQGPRVLITRPKEDAARLEVLLKERGMEVLVEPMMTVAPEAGAKPRLISLVQQNPQAILITSANGVRVLAGAVRERNIPLFTVGAASASEAQRLGFKTVTPADGNALALAELVKKSLSPTAGALLHVAGTVGVGDLKGNLEKSGFSVTRIAAYHAAPVSNFSEKLRAALINCELDIATFYSPRTLRIFDKLVAMAGHSYLLKHVHLVVLSDEVKSVHEWKSRNVAAHSATDAILDLIEELQSGKLRN